MDHLVPRWFCAALLLIGGNLIPARVSADATDDHIQNARVLVHQNKLLEAARGKPAGKETRFYHDATFDQSPRA